MGFGKKFKKAFKKIANQVKLHSTNPIKGIKNDAQIIQKDFQEVGKLFTPKEAKGAGSADVPDPIPPAVAVQAPPSETEASSEGDTESKRRKTAAGGKNKLTVARSSGRGLNL